MKVMLIMDMLKKFFPFSFGAKDVANLIIKIIIYLVIDVVLGFVIGLLSGIPVVGMIISLVSSLIGLYCLAGIVIVILVFCKVLK